MLFGLSGLILGAGTFIYPYLALRDHLLAWNFACSLPIAAALIVIAQKARFMRLPPSNIGVPVFVLWVYGVQVAAKASWPNAADEYGYLFLSDTLLHGRLWNPAPPVEKIFDVAWICIRDGKWFSQYPPAWPALLAPFLFAHVPWLINPLLAAALAFLTRRALRLLCVENSTALSLTVMLACSPFVVFNGASFFPHVMMADLVLAAIILHLHEEAAPSHRLKAALGAVFGIMLLTRYEGVLLTAICYAASKIIQKPARILSDALPCLAGALPFIAVFIAYNTAITGHPFTTPYAWASPGAKMGLLFTEYGFLGACGRALLQSAHWAGELFAYAGPMLVIAALVAFIAKIRARTLLWSDALLPLSIIFFLFYPNSGGHEYGPRYWFFAWPAAVLTIGSALGQPGGWLGYGRLRLHSWTLAVIHIPLFLGMTISLGAFNRAYVTQRQAVYQNLPDTRPAILLIPSRLLKVSPWQQEPIDAWANDFARNGVDLSAPLLFAMADNHFTQSNAFTALACSMHDRRIFRWTPPHDMVRVDCR